MIIGDYIFTIDGIACEPIYGEGLSLVFEREPSEVFFRQKLEGDITFVNADYAYIQAQPFDKQFEIKIEYKGNPYYTGHFDKLACRVNVDDKSVTVNLQNIDQYTEFLNKYDKTVDIIKLQPELEDVHYVKRSVIQILVRGSHTLSNFMGGTKWDQPVSEQDVGHTDLVNKYYFSESNTLYYINLTSNSIPAAMRGTYTGASAPGTYGRAHNVNGDSTYHIRVSARMTHPVQHNRLCREIQIFDASGAVSDKTYSFEDAYYLNTVTIFIGGIQITSIVVNLFAVYARFNTAARSVQGTSTHKLPLEDIVQHNQNLAYGIGYALDTSRLSVATSLEPTEYGKTNSGEYYAQHTNMYGDYFYAIALDLWYRASLWFSFTITDEIFEEASRTSVVLRDAYALHSVINLMVKQINPKFYFNKSSSQFLYGTLGFKYQNMEVLITQKTNILKGKYDQAAQTAPTSLKGILDMLKTVFDCRWRLRGNELIIEHLSFFKNGESLTGTPVVGIDLTTDYHNKHLRPYTFQTNSFEFDSEDTWSSMELSWADRVTKGFELKPSEMTSIILQTAKAEQINIGVFNPDVDYMISEPSNFSSDGFAVLAARKETGNRLVLPIVTHTVDGIKYVTQNSFLVTKALYIGCHTFDLPLPGIKIDGIELPYTKGVKRLKLQTLWYSDDRNPDVTRLVRTEAGNGQIARAAINLTSRRIDLDLQYDTY